MDIKLTEQEAEFLDLIRTNSEAVRCLETISAGGITLRWNTIDVIDWANDRYKGHNIDEDLAADILYGIRQRHDCEYGVTWQHIDAAIWECLSSDHV